jgi:thiol:disulfide interchange protein DsbD
VWLIWVLGSQVGIDGVARLLFGLIAVALGCWIFGELQAKRPAIAMLVVAVLCGAGIGLALPSASPVSSATQKNEDGWTPFSRQKLADARSSGKAVFIDFTATWCITCQVNKRTALNRDEVVKRFAELGVIRMKADWTLKDAEITQTLAEFGRTGVPLYVLYPKSGDPVLLPEILTAEIVLTALENAAPTGNATIAGTAPAK